jgi:hypothetical protein
MDNNLKLLLPDPSDYLRLIMRNVFHNFKSGKMEAELVEDHILQRANTIIHGSNLVPYYEVSADKDVVLR